MTNAELKRSVKKSKSKQKSVLVSVMKPFYLSGVRRRSEALRARRPHHAFQRTRRRDYVRPFEIPGYVRFTNEVFAILWKYKRVYGSLLLLYTVLSALFVGMASQTSFEQIYSALKQVGGSVFSGGWGALGKAGVLFIGGLNGTFTQQQSETQQIYAVILFMLLWLSTVWLLRAQLARRSPRLRDAIYNSSAPLVSTVLIFLLLAVQLLPFAVAVISYITLTAVGIAGQGVLAMITGLVALLLSVLSIYLLTSTFMALVVVTLPGMYPWQALKIAGDLVIGRRIRILLRIIWLLVIIGLLWVIIMIPSILLVNWLGDQFSFVTTFPIVPAILMLLSSFTAIFVSSYVYLLYRKLVDDNASPA